ncbi:hypothetical protein Tco_0866520 [Tanacetum coccineum]
MKLNPSNYTFKVEEGQFLGHIIDGTGIRANPKNFQCNKKKVYEWTEEAEISFQDLKVFLTELPTLTALIPMETLTMYLPVSREPVKPLEWKALENILRPSIEEPPKVELKELPDHLQYAFLQEYQWNRLVILYLQNSHRRWFKPTVQPQRRVNPNIKEAVKKKVTKLLDTGPIYPISDSPWVASKFLLLQKFKRKPPLPVLMETSLIKECLLDYATPNHISALSSFDHCLANLEKMLKRCEETNLVLN